MIVDGDDYTYERHVAGERQATHWAECWRDSGHHACAVAEIELVRQNRDRLAASAVKELDAMRARAERAEAALERETERIVGSQTATETIMAERLAANLAIPKPMIAALLNVTRNERTARQQAEAALAAVAADARAATGSDALWQAISDLLNECKRSGVDVPAPLWRLLPNQMPAPRPYRAAQELSQRAEQAEADRAKLRSALVGLVGVDGKAELEQMEGVMRFAPASAKDKAAALDAIAALLDTLPQQEVQDAS